MRRLALAAALLAPAALRAQAAASAPPSAADRAAVLAVVVGLFDAMRAGDSARVRAAFHPQAQLATTLVRGAPPAGTPEVRLDSLGGFVRAVGTPHAEVWDERLRDTVVHVDGPLAQVWTGYAFYAGRAFSHCGVDAFTLGRTPAGWRILAIADTRRRAGCPEQDAGR